jgi:hypothetical protein
MRDQVKGEVFKDSCRCGVLASVYFRSEKLLVKLLQTTTSILEKFQLYIRKMSIILGLLHRLLSIVNYEVRRIKPGTLISTTVFQVIAHWLWDHLGNPTFQVRCVELLHQLQSVLYSSDVAENCIGKYCILFFYLC